MSGNDILSYFVRAFTLIGGLLILYAIFAPSIIPYGTLARW